MKQCPNCGAELSDDAAFCSYCGSRLETPPPEAVKTEPIPTNPASANPFKTGRQMTDRPMESNKPQPKKKRKSPRKKGRTLGIALIVLFLAILLAEGEKASEETPAADSTALSADSALMEPESSSVASSSHAEDRAEKDGFDASTNESYTFAAYEIEIPVYWDSATENSIDGGIQRYAETGGKVAMLQITARAESDPNYPVTFDGLMADNDNMIASLESGVFDEVTDYEVIDTGNVKGILYKGPITVRTNDISTSGYGEWFTFPSETDRHWCTIVLSQTDNTVYSYTEDFMKIIQSIRTLEPSSDGTATSSEESSESSDFISDYELAFVRDLPSYDLYIMFDTDTQTAAQFGTDDTYLYKGPYTGDFSSGVTIAWDHGEFTEKFVYQEGSHNGTLYDGNGFPWEYSRCDLKAAQDILSTRE